MIYFKFLFFCFLFVFHARTEFNFNHKFDAKSCGVQGAENKNLDFDSNFFTKKTYDQGDWGSCFLVAASGLFTDFCTKHDPDFKTEVDEELRGDVPFQLNSLMMLAGDGQYQDGGLEAYALYKIRQKLQKGQCIRKRYRGLDPKLDMYKLLINYNSRCKVDPSFDPLEELITAFESVWKKTNDASFIKTIEGLRKIKQESLSNQDLSKEARNKWLDKVASFLESDLCGAGYRPLQNFNIYVERPDFKKIAELFEKGIPVSLSLTMTGKTSSNQEEFLGSHSAIATQMKVVNCGGKEKKLIFIQNSLDPSKSGLYDFEEVANYITSYTYIKECEAPNCSEGILGDYSLAVALKEADYDLLRKIISDQKNVAHYFALEGLLNEKIKIPLEDENQIITGYHYQSQLKILANDPAALKVLLDEVKKMSSEDLNQLLTKKFTDLIQTGPLASNGKIISKDMASYDYKSPLVYKIFDNVSYNSQDTEDIKKKKIKKLEDSMDLIVDYGGDFHHFQSIYYYKNDDELTTTNGPFWTELVKSSELSSLAIKYLKKNAYNVNDQDNRGHTPLIYAVESSNLNLVKEILKKNPALKYKYTPPDGMPNSVEFDTIEIAKKTLKTNDSKEAKDILRLLYLKMGGNH